MRYFIDVNPVSAGESGLIIEGKKRNYLLIVVIVINVIYHILTI